MVTAAGPNAHLQCEAPGVVLPDEEDGPSAPRLFGIRVDGALPLQVMELLPHRSLPHQVTLQPAQSRHLIASQSLHK